jgi:N-dimethylarginine dimethylaminohydrolase
MKILVCDPSHYQINYEINPWMSLSLKADNEKAIQQWESLVDKLESLGVDVVKVDPVLDLPDMVFTANAGFRFGNHVLLSNFKYKERQPEKDYFKNWFSKKGYKVVELPEGIRFEGAGDCLIGDNNFLFMGYGFRSDLEAYYDNIWDSIFDYHFRSLRLRLIDPYFYHLDTCFCPLNKNQVLFYPGAFERHDIISIEKRFEAFKVPEDEAKKFACNAVLIGDNIIIPKGCEVTRDILTHNYYIVHELEMSEFIKAGGACKCLTLVV